MQCRTACRPSLARPRQQCCVIRQAPAAVTVPRWLTAHRRTVPATGPVNGNSDVQGSLPDDRVKRLEFQMDALQAQMNKLITGNVPVTNQSIVGLGTISEIGNEVKAKAQLVELVRITDAGRTLAQNLLKAAGAAGADLVSATQVQSRLPEKSSGPSLQKVVSNFVAAQQWDGRSRLWDTSNARSICGDNLEPDLLLSLGPDKPLPSSTFGLVDIKRQDETYSTGANFYQLVQCGAAVFNQLPPTSRPFLLLGVTDFKTIQFLGMTRGPNNEYSYQLSSTMPDVLEVLCSILASTATGDADARGNLSVPPQFGAGMPPNLTFSGQRLQLLSVLGRGATSTVYECQLGEEQVAAKVLNDPLAAVAAAADPVAHEVAMLQLVKGCDGVVQMAGELDCGRGFMLRPVGHTLARLRQPLEVPRLFRAMERLLCTVRSVHNLRIVHRDLRGSNLLLDGDVIRIMDWGCAVKLADGIMPSFAGALLCASNRVLEILDLGGTPQPEFTDDLETLAKSVYLLLHPSSDIELHRLATPPRFGDILNFWVSELEERPSWQEILAFARACDYDALGKALRGKLE